MKIRATSCGLFPAGKSPLAANGRPRALAVVEDDADLEANIALLHGAGRRLLLVSIDALFAGSRVTRLIHETASQFGDDVDVFLAATHTHRAPAIDPGKPKLGVAQPLMLDGVCERLEAAIASLLSATDATNAFPFLSLAEMHGLSVHRRARGRLRLTKRGLRLSGIVAAPNFEISVQRQAARIDWQDKSGNVVCVMWHWACHPTGVPKWNLASADYVGVVRRAIREEVGPVPVLFFQGFAGDIRPPAFRTWRRNPIVRLLNGPGFRKYSAREYSDWSNAIAARIVGNKKAPLFSDEKEEALYSRRIELSSSEFVEGSATPLVTFQDVRIGQLRLTGVSAEPTFAHVPPDNFLGDRWFCGYVDDVYGYLPTLQQLDDGGYEAGGFCERFGCSDVKPMGIRLLSTFLHGGMAKACVAGGDLRGKQPRV